MEELLLGYLKQPFKASAPRPLFAPSTEVTHFRFQYTIFGHNDCSDQFEVHRIVSHTTGTINTTLTVQSNRNTRGAAKRVLPAVEDTAKPIKKAKVQPHETNQYKEPLSSELSS